MSVDCSFKKTEEGSRVSILVLGGDRTRRFMLDNVTRPMTFTETCDAIRSMAKKWPKIGRILIEDKANGTAVIETLMLEVGAAIIAIEPEGGKESRAAAISSTVEAGYVYLPDGAEWLDDFVHELSVFPNGAKDDQVDSLSQALIDMQAGSDRIMFQSMSTL
jgi:predicted phage terminase large subunit-like protein